MILSNWIQPPTGVLKVDIGAKTVSRLVERVYLDVNIFREWFVRMIRGDATEVFYVKFLAEHKEIEKFISIFSIAELVETLLKEKDDKIGRVKEVYPNVEGIRSLIRRHGKKTK